jgi:hypothetical protein
VDLAAIVAAFFGVPDYEGITTRMRGEKRDEYRAVNSATGKQGQNYPDLGAQVAPITKAEGVFAKTSMRYLAIEFEWHRPPRFRNGRIRTLNLNYLIRAARTC